MKEKIICKYCEKEFEDYKSNHREFCSKKCWYLWKNTQIEKICVYCGKKYKVSNCEKDSIFCSPKCKGQYKHKHQSEKRNCKFCGTEFSVKISDIKRGRGIYCSHQCQMQCPDWKRYLVEIIKRNRRNEGDIYPNKSETKLNDMIQELKLPYKFVGNGKIWIAGVNPDFINVNGQKKIIELFGEYWHQGKKVPYYRTEKGRKKVFAEYGYDTLVIWCRELRDIETLKQKLLTFEQMPHIQ